MVTVAILAGLIASFAAGVFLLLAATRVSAEQIWWPLLLGTETRTLPKSDRLAIIERLGAIRDPWRDPILRCAREQERDPEMLEAISAALAAEE